MKHEYESDILQGEFADHGPGFKTYDTIISRGRDVEDLLANATVSIIDQDGESVGEIGIGELPADLYEIAERDIVEYVLASGEYLQ